jgi:hypothetical protein
VLKIVTKEQEYNVKLSEAELTSNSSDTDIIKASEFIAKTILKDFVVSRHGQNILVSPSPIFG